MAFNVKDFLTKYTNIGQLFGFTGIAIHAYEDAKSSVDLIQSGIQAAIAAGASEDELKQISTAAVYDKVESEGKNVDDFWQGLSPEVQAELKFSPESLRRAMNRTSFLGIAGAVLFVGAAIAGGIAVARGIPIGLSTLSKIAAARQAGASATELMVFLEEGKILGIAKVWLPSLIGGLLTAGGWLTSSMTNNLNDVDLWGRINLQQAEDDFKKAQAAAARLAAGGPGGTTPRQPVTRITMAKSSTPKVALGTIFSFNVDKYKVFERVLDDAITSKEDLQLDAVANLNKYLSTIPGRLIVSISIALNPFGEDGIKLQGTWVVMQIGVKGLTGRFSPLDTIPLGPINPQIYQPTPRETLTIQQEIPKLLTSEEIANVSFPSTDFKVVDAGGNVVPVLPTVATAKPTQTDGKTTQTAPADTVKSVQQGTTKAYIRFGFDALTFAYLTARYVPLSEFSTISKDAIEEKGVNAWQKFTFANGKSGIDAIKENLANIKAGGLDMLYPEFGIGASQPPPATLQPAPVAVPPVGVPPFVRYAGSPNIFDRKTGEYLTQSVAVNRGVYNAGQISDISTPRPEVKVASDFAKWDGKNLTTFPV